MTPKKRMLKSTVGLARALKPTGRLNRDDVVNARSKRSKMSLSEIKDAKKLGKSVASIGSMMSKGMSALAAKNLMKKARELKPLGRINMDDIKRIKQKTPMKKALGPLRPLRERSQSKLVSRRRGTSKR